MKINHALAAFALIAASALTVSCDKLVDKAVRAAMESINHDYQDSEKWGKVTTVELPALAFHEVELSGAVRLEYTQDSVYSIQVYGNEKAIEAYSIKVDDEELEVTLKDDNGKIDKDTPAITIRISAPYLTEINGSGASEVAYMNNVAQEEELEVKLAGLGIVNFGELKARELGVTVNGAGEVSMTSVDITNDAELRVAGAAHLSGKLAAKKLEIKLTGAASGLLDIQTREADVTCSGASDLTLTGQTGSLELNSGGASSVKKDGLKVGL